MLGGQVSAYEAQMRLGGCRTGVRRSLIRDAVARVLVLHLSYFLLFIFFHGFAPTQLDSRRLDFDSCRTGLIRPESGCISRQLKWQKQAEIGLESCRNMSSHGGIGDDDDKVELLELGSVYGTRSILMFLFQVLHWDTLCLCL